MNYETLINEKDLEVIEEMAAHGFIFSEIAEVIAQDNIDRKAIVILLNDPEHPAHLAFRKGFLRAKLELHQRIFIDAKHGSSPAQTLAAKILDEAEYQMFEK